MAFRGRQNIPGALVAMGREVVGFLQTLLDYERVTIQTGMRVKWRSTESLTGYLQCNGATITNANYPDLIRYAANDPDFTVGATTTTLPTDVGFWVKT